MASRSSPRRCVGPTAPAGKGSGATTPVTIPGQPAPGAKDTKGFQVPSVEMPGGQKIALPAPGQPGGLIVPEGTPPEEIKRRVAAEMERLKKMDAEAAKKGAGTAAPATPATPKQ